MEYVGNHQTGVEILTECIVVDSLSVDYISMQKRGLFSFERKTTVRAIENVTFKINRGEVVALLGDNGAGKSTLLSVIGGELRPVKGRVVTTGKVFTLKGSNPGLVPSMSARENIRLLGRAYGIEEEEMPYFEKNLEDFCDLGEAFDRKYSSLSSGMAGRVGFGFTTSLNPDILLMDETLGVGDKNFRAKAEKKAIDFMERGETILISTHSLNLAKDMCSRGIVLERGELVFDGEINAAVDFYLGR